jgi:hypothetical protein
MRRCILICFLMLAACGSDPEAVTLTPKLTCAEMVKCRVIEWQIGFRRATFVSGTHIECRCTDAT